MLPHAESQSPQRVAFVKAVKIYITLFVSSRGSLEGRVPSLRFPGFEGEWKPQQWNAIGRFFGGLTGKNKDDFGHGTASFITYMNVYRNTIADAKMCELVDVAYGERQNVVVYGDVLFTQSSETVEEIGFASVWLHNTRPYLNSFCFGFRLTSESVSPLWFVYFMRSQTTRRLIMREGQGITRVNLSAERLKNICLNLPPLSEQNKIATFLSLLDSRIAAQRKLVTLLKKQKRGLLREIFERNAEGKCKSFYDIVVRRSEKVTPTKDSGLDCIELEHIEPETGLLLGSVQLREQDSLKNLCKPNDIVFGRLRPYLRKFLFAKTECAVSSETWVLTAADGILPKFLFYLIQSEPFMQAANVSSGTKMPRSEWSNVANAKFHIPNAGRQLAIANCLSEVDTRIHQTQRVISAMEVYKRGLLQALFV